eukprot:g14489.t1
MATDVYTLDDVKFLYTAIGYLHPKQIRFEIMFQYDRFVHNNKYWDASNKQRLSGKFTRSKSKKCAPSWRREGDLLTVLQKSKILASKAFNSISLGRARLNMEDLNHIKAFNSMDDYTYDKTGSNGKAGLTQKSMVNGIIDYISNFPRKQSSEKEFIALFAVTHACLKNHAYTSYQDVLKSIYEEQFKLFYLMSIFCKKSELLDAGWVLRGTGEVLVSASVVRGGLSSQNPCQMESS